LAADQVSGKFTLRLFAALEEVSLGAICIKVWLVLPVVLDEVVMMIIIMSMG